MTAYSNHVYILGVRVDPVTYDQMLACVARFVEDGRPHQICTVNPEFVMAAQQDVAFRAVLAGSDLCLPDGVGLLWAARKLRQRLPERVTGSDSVPRIAELAARRGWRVFFLGAGPGVAAAAAEWLSRSYPGLIVAGAYPGSPSDAEAPYIVDMVRRACPHVLLVAYGAPNQDLWIGRHRNSLGVPVMMGVGGALDHLTGRQRRAPVGIQRMGLEWLFRLITQPWRWRRQLALPRFAWDVFRARGRAGKQSTPETGIS